MAPILDSYTCVSFEKVMMDFEVMEYVNRYLIDIEVDEESIPEELIDELGHEAGYLLSEHTLDHCHSEPLIPSLAVRGASMIQKASMKKILKNRWTVFLINMKNPKRMQRYWKKCGKSFWREVLGKIFSIPLKQCRHRHTQRLLYLAICG